MKEMISGSLLMDIAFLYFIYTYIYTYKAYRYYYIFKLSLALLILYHSLIITIEFGGAHRAFHQGSIVILAKDSNTHTTAYKFVLDHAFAVPALHRKANRPILLQSEVPPHPPTHRQIHQKLLYHVISRDFP